jgi:hypothetical protein
MKNCVACGRNGVAPAWEFCPYCGGILQEAAPAAHPSGIGGIASSLLNLPQGSVTEKIVGLASRALENKFNSSGLGKVLAPHPRASMSVPSEPAPEWYLRAVHEQQPKMDPTELARLQAQEATRTQLATESMRAALDTMRSMTRSLK